MAVIWKNYWEMSKATGNSADAGVRSLSGGRVPTEAPQLSGNGSMSCSRTVTVTGKRIFLLISC